MFTTTEKHLEFMKNALTVGTNLKIYQNLIKLHGVLRNVFVCWSVSLSETDMKINVVLGHPYIQDNNPVQNNQVDRT